MLKNGCRGGKRRSGRNTAREFTKIGGSIEDRNAIGCTKNQNKRPFRSRDTSKAKLSRN